VSEAEQEIATRLGSGFAAIAMRFLPAIREGLTRNPSKDISFGATVKCKLEAGVIVGRLIAHEPKIPTEGMEPVHFILQQDVNGQLSFLFAGSLKELRAEAEKQGNRLAADDYVPSHAPTS
jgi:hypothetical protein